MPIYWPPNDSQGPGTELAKLLSRWGYRSTAACDCDGHVVRMNREGSDWCEQHLEMIVTWLEEEARKQSLRFHRWPARQLVRLAIRRARRREQSRR